MRVNLKKSILIFLAMAMTVCALALPGYAATTVTVLDGKVSVTDILGTGSVSADGNTVTVTATGGTFSTAKNSITITNETEKTATISFDYTVTGISTEWYSSDKFSFDGNSGNGTWSYSGDLAAGSSVAMTLNEQGGSTAKVVMSNFSIVLAADTSNVTINYDSTLGSVTAGGSTVAAGSTVAGVTLADGVALTATPASGSTFLGWVNAADNKIISTAANYTLIPTADMTVKAAFAKDGGTLWFGVGGTTQKSDSTGLMGVGKLYYYTVGTSYLFDNLNAAASHASVNSTKTIVLMNSGTLPAGTYTIPSGVTLLIPFDSANTMYTTQVQNTGTYTTPIAYRTLTMASGANLTVNGAVSLSAMQKYANGGKMGGVPTGGYGHISMNDGSTITVNSGGTLYAYGFITGSGSVTANSGATVYEMFQFMDFRGGTQSTDMQNGVFPLSQYYMQNIEVPMTIYSGATEYAYKSEAKRS